MSFFYRKNIKISNFHPKFCDFVRFSSKTNIVVSLVTNTHTFWMGGHTIITTTTTTTITISNKYDYIKCIN